jgi:DNA (cytosine-5)-methyltransferase 1
MAMESLGYIGQMVFLNSMHAQVFGPGAPQSRDRFYAVFSRIGAPKPEVSRVVSPSAICPECGPVRAVQSWKRLDRTPWGKYRSQYVYRCPNTNPKCRNQILEPHYRPASDIIDWSLAGTRIGDRARPLAAKTMARIVAGIERYWGPLLVPVEGRPGKNAHPVSAPARTMTTRSETGLLVPTGGTWRTGATSTGEPISTRTTREKDGIAFPPFIAELRGGSCDARLASTALSTVTASGNHHGLICGYYSTGTNVNTTADPLSTVTTIEKHALLMPHNTPRGDHDHIATPTNQPPRMITTAGHWSLPTAAQPMIAVEDVMFRMLEPTEISAAMDFPREYTMVGTRRERVRLAGNAVTPPAARDLVGVVVEALSGQTVIPAA